MDIVQQVMLGAYALATGVFGALPSKPAPAPQTPPAIVAPAEKSAETSVAPAAQAPQEAPKAE